MFVCLKIKTLSAYEIKELFKRGGKIKGRYISLRYLNTGEKKVGVGAYGKVKSKPVRNRIKRRLRELFRLNWDILPDFYIFMVGRSAAAEVEWKKLEKDFLRLIEVMKKS